MYYEKLIDTYRESDCHLEFPTETLELFDNFIRDEKNLNHKFLNPYKFSLLARISIAESIKFFLYFTGEQKLLHPLPFIDCFNASCTGERIFFHESEGIDEGVIVCEGCGKEYLLEEIKKFVMIYFELNPNVEIPTYQKHLSSKDPNSTYSILEGLPDTLKVTSPLSSPKVDEGEIKGEEAVSLDQVLAQNTTPQGTQIISPNDLLEIKLRERLSRGRN